MTRKPNHYQRGQKFKVVYPIDSDNALLHAIADNGAEIFKGAESGDQTAAAQAISNAIMFLVEHRDTRMSIPRSLCDWLLKGLEAAAKGNPMEIAMGLRRRGARNVWSMSEKKRAITLLWIVRDYLKKRPSRRGQDYYEVTARWFSDSVVPAELAGFADARASTSWVPMVDGTLPYSDPPRKRAPGKPFRGPAAKCVTADVLREWERQAVAVKVTSEGT